MAFWRRGKEYLTWEKESPNGNVSYRSSSINLCLDKYKNKLTEISSPVSFLVFAFDENVSLIIS